MKRKQVIKPVRRIDIHINGKVVGCIQFFGNQNRAGKRVFRHPVEGGIERNIVGAVSCNRNDVDIFLFQHVDKGVTSFRNDQRIALKRRSLIILDGTFGGRLNIQERVTFLL